MWIWPFQSWFISLQVKSLNTTEISTINVYHTHQVKTFLYTLYALDCLCNEYRFDLINTVKHNCQPHDGASPSLKTPHFYTAQP